MTIQPTLPLEAVPPARAPRAAPHNLEAEQALLGAILFDNETYNRITPLLQDRHFFDPEHGRIFLACAEVISAGDLADGCERLCGVRIPPNPCTAGPIRPWPRSGCGRESHTRLVPERIRLDQSRL